MPAKLSGKLAGKAGTEPQLVEMRMPGVSSLITPNRINPRCRTPRGGARATQPAGLADRPQGQSGVRRGGVNFAVPGAGDSAGSADGHGDRAQTVFSQRSTRWFEA